MTDSVSLFSLLDAKRFIKRQLVNAEWEMRTPPSFISKGEFCFFNLQHLSWTYLCAQVYRVDVRNRRSYLPYHNFTSSLPYPCTRSNYPITGSVWHVAHLNLFSSFHHCWANASNVVLFDQQEVHHRSPRCAVDERTVDYCARFAFFVKALV